MLSKIQIDSFCKKYKIKDYSISKDFLLTVEGDVYLGGKDKRCSYNKWEELPVKFEKINGDFTLELKSLKSLKGCPKIVAGSFVIRAEELSSLNFCPKNIGGDFICEEIKLKSLEGGPKNVKGDFNCSNNKLDSLIGSPKKIKGNFDCSVNNITSLIGSPKKIKGNFHCYMNNITSLIGSPKKIKGQFNCSENKITSLINMPKYIGDGLICCENDLTSLIGCSEYVRGELDCSDNKLTSLEGLPSNIERLYLSNNNLYNLYDLKFNSDVALYFPKNPIRRIYGLITNQRNVYMKYYSDKVEAFNDYGIIYWEKKAGMKPIICLEKLQLFLRIENITMDEKFLKELSKDYMILKTETEYLAYISENFY